MKILAKDIKNKEMVKYILDSLKPIDKYIDTLSEDSFEYENMCQKVEDRYLEVDEALVGKELITDQSILNADIRRMTYWKYIKGEISWKRFVKDIKKYSNKLLIHLN